MAAGMILDREPGELTVDTARHRRAQSAHVRSRASLVSTGERRERLGQQPATVWLTGLPKAGKSTVAFALERRLFNMGYHAHVLDGENLRLTVCRDLGFSANDRSENIRRAAGVARILNEGGLITIAAFLSPYAADRRSARGIIGENRFIEVHISTPIDVCRQRDTDDLYAEADKGAIPVFSGVTAPYEPPTSPDLTLPTHELSVEVALDRLVQLLSARGIIG